MVAAAQGALDDCHVSMIKRNWRDWTFPWRVDVTVRGKENAKPWTIMCVNRLVHLEARDVLLSQTIFEGRIRSLLPDPLVSATTLLYPKSFKTGHRLPPVKDFLHIGLYFELNFVMTPAGPGPDESIKRGLEDILRVVKDGPHSRRIMVYFARDGTRLAPNAISCLKEAFVNFKVEGNCSVTAKYRDHSSHADGDEMVAMVQDINGQSEIFVFCDLQ